MTLIYQPTTTYAGYVGIVAGQKLRQTAHKRSVKRLTLEQIRTIPKRDRPR